MAGAVRLYPEVGSRRRSTMIRDLFCLVLIAFFVWCGIKTYHGVDDLSVFGHAVADTGTSIQSSFGSVANAVGNLPIVGGSLASALGNAGSGTGGNLESLGQQGVNAVHRLAVLLGLLVGLLPILVLLVAALPSRIRQVRSMSAAASALSNRADPTIQRLLASRAAFGLPYATLLAHTSDPFGDLAAGEYDALIAAALEDAGLRATTYAG